LKKAHDIDLDKQKRDFVDKYDSQLLKMLSAQGIIIAFINYHYNQIIIMIIITN